MVKLSGGSRTLTGGSREYSRREVEFNQLRNSGRYSSGYFSDKGGGYVLVERSSMPHEKDEIEAAMYLADKGYIVTLMDESINSSRASSLTNTMASSLEKSAVAERPVLAAFTR